MIHRPLLSDVQATKLRPKAGDKMIVRVSSDLTRDQIKHITKSLQSFVGEEVSVLIVNCLKMRVTWRKWFEKEDVVLVEPTSIKSEINLGVANVDCSVIELRPNDTLVVQHKHLHTDLQRDQIRQSFIHWAGKDVEVIVIKGEF